MKRFSLIIVLALVLVLAVASVAFAAAITPSPTPDETNSSKTTPYPYYDRIQTDTSNGQQDGRTSVYADPLPHGPENTVNGGMFYLPDGVPSDTARVHSNYTKNTDACAACHFTHTAVGARLLQWESIYKACAACHDGSLGDYTYDVFNGYIGTQSSNVRTYGGLFTTEPGEIDDSTSTHMPNGYMALSAAPGAATDANENMVNYQFDCSSCHTPHGQGGNARILSPDPGRALIEKVFASNSNSTYDTPAQKADYIESNFAVLSNDSNFDGRTFTDSRKHWIQGYPYNKVTRFYKVPRGTVIAALGFDFDMQKGLTVTGANITELIITGAAKTANIDWRNGKVTLIRPADNVEILAVRVPGIFVAMDIDNYLDNEADDKETVNYVAYSTGEGGIDGASDQYEGINAYCGACHGDYNTQGYDGDFSVADILNDYDFVEIDGDHTEVNHGSGYFGYKGAYRHQVGFSWAGQWTGEANYIKFAYNIENGAIKTDADDPKVFTCLGCHFAHGTNNQYWLDYVERVNDDNDTTAPADLNDLEDFSETYGSSALKRLPNMATCENCHDKASGNAKDTYTVGGNVYTYY